MAPGLDFYFFFCLGIWEGWKLWLGSSASTGMMTYDAPDQVSSHKKIKSGIRAPLETLAKALLKSDSHHFILKNVIIVIFRFRSKMVLE